MHRNYTDEYRQEAVKLAEEKGSSIAARELGIPVDTLYTWVLRAKRGAMPVAKKTEIDKKKQSPEERIRELEAMLKAERAEKAQILREREILEGATAFFAVRQKR